MGRVPLVAALLVALVAAYIIHDLREDAVQAREAARHLAKFEAQAYRLSGLEWRATAEQNLAPEVAKEAEEAYGEMSVLMGELEHARVQSGMLERVREHYDVYEGATRDQLRLLDAGELEGAMVVDEERVDPAFEELSDAFVDAERAYDTLARRAAWAADVGSLLTLIVAAGAIGGLLRAGGRARLAAESLAIERRVLLENEERLRHQAVHDPLTGLPNRVLLLDRLRHALARHVEGDRYAAAVLFMDLDNFKVINDSLGHAAGDALLVAVGKRLRAAVRSEDTVARISGDEFVVLLKDLDKEIRAAQMAERLVERLRAPFNIGDNEVFVTSSTGIALGTSADTPDDLLRSADIAMYRAKYDGKSSYRMFDTQMDAETHERLALENDLRRAIEKGDLNVHYQPCVAIGTGLRPRPELTDDRAVGSSSPADTPRVVGMEALVRWEHPERGPISPSRFIPIAEETGLIDPLGRFVLERACRQAREWQERYPSDPPLRISVNLSTRQFRAQDFAEQVEGVLNDTGLEPGSLLLEVTETVLMEDVERNVAVLERLKGLGIRVAIDDFGTGYSSLSYLKRLPADFLKIDRSFVDGLVTNHEDQTIIAGTLGLAQAVGMRTIAEGVETAEQLTRLRAMGCELAQGYYFSRPLASEAASAFLAGESGRHRERVARGDAGP